MPLTLVIENGTGLANANAFASRAAVSAALEASPFALAWASVDPDVQDQCIAEATLWLSAQAWRGVPTTATQALAWPRAGVEREGYVIDGDVVPAWLVTATARAAFYLSQQAASPFADTGLAAGTELVVGPIRLTPSSGGPPLPPDVKLLIAPYLRGRSSLVRA